LFVYGTLMDPLVFRTVLGKRLVSKASDADDAESFYARPALLAGYKKISPDQTYLYAVPARGAHIKGYLVEALPGKCLDALRKYEGRNYSRRKVRVQTEDSIKTCIAFVGNLKQMEHSFGYAFHDELKQEILLGDKINAALLETEREKLHTEEGITRRAVGELRGLTIRDLTRRHFEAGGISDYAIRHSLKDMPLPDFSRITNEPEAKAIAPHYLSLVVRQVIFNQFEEKVRREFRYELNHLNPGESYYERTVSSLVALLMLNAAMEQLDSLVATCLRNLSFNRDHLIDYVIRAVKASDKFYDSQTARRQLQYIRKHRVRGYIPLGAELEFSNIGHGVISDPQGKALCDSHYDGFLLFGDFGLDVLTWKLGGHIDDHYDKASTRPRRGFFELAIGNVSIKANLSRPITDDPWLLNRFIHAVCRFYDILPHSVHISLQLRSQHRPMQNRTLSCSVMKCLFAIAGDARRGADGKLQITRLVTDEIAGTERGHRLLFSEITRRYSRESSDSYPLGRDPHAGGRYVQQFRFLRLSPDLNYEAIVMAVKGMQLRLGPGNFLTASQYESSPKHRKLYESLLAWGASPRPISAPDIEKFLRYVREGLMKERRGKPAHTEAYIDKSIRKLRGMLEKFNVRASSHTKR